jgi:Protein of unknown function (DUF2971)
MPDTPSDGLFHYTTPEGALGILETQNLYATHVRYLNDISEIDHFKGFVLAELLELSNRIKVDDERLFSYVRTIASDFAASIVDEVEKLADIFTISFSVPATDFIRKNGLLSQWRSYGSDGGVIIELDQKKFGDLLYQQGMRSENLYNAETVTYGDDIERIAEMKEIFRRDVSEHFESLVYRLHARRTEPGPKEPLSESISEVLKGDLQIYTDVLSKISKWAIFFKHEGFREECEYRVSIQRPLYPGARDEQVLFRLKKGIPIPYILLLSETGELPIRRLIIGPHRDAKSRFSSFEKIVARRGIKATVDLSKIPFV